MPFSWTRCKVLGKGSFGTVYLATTERPSLPVIAVKSAILDPSRCSSLINEINVLVSLGNCPEIVRCYGSNVTLINVGEERGIKCFNVLLEYASEGTLSDLIGSHGLTEALTVRYTRMILKGLFHIHSKGFVHCDLKPDNILAFPDNKLKIADFGLSRTACNYDHDEFRIGALQYTSPESVREGQIGPPLDIWALGCIVVEMLTSEDAVPWDDSSSSESFAWKIGLLPKIPDNISDCAKDFLKKCFASNPDERWTAEMLLGHEFVAGTAVRSLPCFLPHQVFASNTAAWRRLLMMTGMSFACNYLNYFLFLIL